MYNTASLLPYLPELLILLPSGVCRPPAKEPSLVLGSPLKDDSMRQSVMNIKGRGGGHRWGGDERGVRRGDEMTTAFSYQQGQGQANHIHDQNA